MNQNEAWNKFKKSGSVEDYLAYAKTKKRNRNDHENGGDDC